MRIIVIGAPPLTVALQCVAALRRDGHDARYINYRFAQCHRFSFTNTWMNNHIVRTCQLFKPDLVFVIKGETLLKGTITKLRKTGAMAAVWVIDEPTGKYYPTGRITNLEEYDHVFSFDKSYLKLIKKLGAPKASYLPIAVDESFFFEAVPVKKRKIVCDTLFIGTYYPNRASLLRTILNTDLRIYGPHWSSNIKKDDALWLKLHVKSINGSRACKYFNQTRININQTHEQAVNGGINLRIPEVLATRSFLLTNELKGLDKIFIPGKELVTFSSITDFKNKVGYYIANPDERQRIADAGYKKFLAKHTMTHRMRQIIDELELRA